MKSKNIIKCIALLAILCSSLTFAADAPKKKAPAKPSPDTAKVTTILPGVNEVQAKSINQYMGGDYTMAFIAGQPKKIVLTSQNKEEHKQFIASPPAAILSLVKGQLVKKVHVTLDTNGSLSISFIGKDGPIGSYSESMPGLAMSLKHSAADTTASATTKPMTAKPTS